MCPISKRSLAEVWVKSENNWKSNGKQCNNKKSHIGDFCPHYVTN